MKILLKDGAPRSVGHVDVNVSKKGNVLEVGPVGVIPAPIGLEYYDGKLRLRVYQGSMRVFMVDLDVTPAPEPFSDPKPNSEPEPIDNLDDI